jgi:hypothetical protein
MHPLLLTFIAVALWAAVILLVIYASESSTTGTGQND